MSMQTDPNYATKRVGAFVKSDRDVPVSPTLAPIVERSGTTRVLHVLLLLATLHQLIGSNFVERPLPGEDPDWPYALHVWTGVAGLVTIALFWMWTLLRGANETPAWRLVPWFSSAARGALLDDVAALATRLKSLKPPSEDYPALASAVHGLGLAIFTFMAASGASWYFVFAGGPVGKYVIVLHKLAANVMWAYLIAHASVAVLHHAAGGDVVMRMFAFKGAATKSQGDSG